MTLLRLMLRLMTLVQGHEAPWKKFFIFWNHGMQIKSEFYLKLGVHFKNSVRERERPPDDPRLIICSAIISNIVVNESQTGSVCGGSSHVDHIMKEKILHFEKWQTNGAWKHALPNSNYRFLPQPLQRNSTQSTSTTPVYTISSIMN